MKNRLISFAVALLAAFALWFYVVTVVNSEDSKNLYGIPVTFSGEDVLREDHGLIITDGAETTVNLRLTGKRSTLQKLEVDNVSIVVDVSTIRRASDNNEKSYSIVYPNGVSGNDINVVTQTPGTITFKVEQLARKQIEVKCLHDGTVAEGYTTDPMTFDYSEIIVEGPEELVESISYAQAILSRENVDKTIVTSLPFTLIDSEGNAVESDELTTNVTEIEVTLPVLAYKDVPLTVEFLDGGGATAADVVCSISPQTITVSGEPTLLEGINQISLGNINLGDILESTETRTMPITLPNGVRNISGEETAEVEVRINGLATKVVRATNIVILPSSIPEGYEAETLTQVLQVTVRASSSDIENISADNVRIVADLSAAGLTQDGSSFVPVTIFVDGFEKAGIIGDYTILVRLKSS